METEDLFRCRASVQHQAFKCQFCIFTLQSNLRGKYVSSDGIRERALGLGPRGPTFEPWLLIISCVTLGKQLNLSEPVLALL